ncbi:MAG: hypothetical protein KC441_04340 [Anaerolineales bacterium]|nr:hypothetical protein [Anaerolineales bacterium]
MAYESLFAMIVYDFAAYQVGGEDTLPAEEHETAVAQLRNISPGAAAVIDETGSSQGWAGWDRMEEEVVSVSCKYPDLLFVVTVDSDDCTHWRFFAHNGRRQIAEGYVTYDDILPDNWSDDSLYTSRNPCYNTAYLIK